MKLHYILIMMNRSEPILRLSSEYNDSYLSFQTSKPWLQNHPPARMHDLHECCVRTHACIHALCKVGVTQCEVNARIPRAEQVPALPGHRIRHGLVPERLCRRLRTCAGDSGGQSGTAALPPDSRPWFGPRGPAAVHSPGLTALRSDPVQ